MKSQSNKIHIITVQQTKQKLGQVDDHREQVDRQLLIFNKLSPLYNTMKLFGLYYDSPSSQQGCPGGAVSRCTARYVYSTFVLVLVWFNFLRSFSLFVGDTAFGPELFMKVIFVSWFGLCTVQTTCLYRACGKVKGGVPELHRMWMASGEYIGPDHERFFRQRCMRYTIIGWILILSNIMFGCYTLWNTTLFDFVIAPFTPDSSHAYVYRALYCVIHLYLSAAWAMPMAYYYMLSATVYRKFQKQNQVFEEFCAKNDYSISAENIEVFRTQHVQAGKYLDVVDDIIHVSLGASVITMVILVCLILYNIIWYTEVLSDPMVALMTVFWAAAALGTLTIISVGGAYVNHVAHEAYDTIHQLRVVGASAEMNLQINMFLNRVSSGSIGLTAMKMFVIDKPTILTLLGMLITYFVLIVQFVPGSASENQLNCTQILMNASQQCTATG